MGYPTTLHYGVAGYPYTHHPYALAHPAVTYAAPVAPTVAVKPYTYYANSGGAVHIVKRDAEAKPEAEAEASPESWYYGYYGHPYRWGGYYGDGVDITDDDGDTDIGVKPSDYYFREINFTKFFVKSISRNLTRKM